MSRRMLMMAVAVFATQIAAGCCTQRAYLFPRLHCGAAPLVPMSPVVRYPIGVRPCCGPTVAAAPVVGDPSCSSCMSSPGAVTVGAKPIAGPIYTMGGTTGYGTGVPHDSVLLPQPTVIPPGTPKVEATTEPKPMPK